MGPVVGQAGRARAAEDGRAADDELAMLADDAEAMRGSRIEYGAPPPPLPREREDEGGGGAKSLKDRVNDLLVADFFFILACLALFAAGLAQRAGDPDDKSPLLDAFVGAWPWLIQPAITLLMAGAIVQGASGWLSEKLGGRSE